MEKLIIDKIKELINNIFEINLIQIFIGSDYLGSVNSIAQFSKPSNSFPLSSIIIGYSLSNSFLSNFPSSWYSVSTIRSLYLSKLIFLLALFASMILVNSTKALLNPSG